VSSVGDMSHMFRETPFNRDIGSWDVSSVGDMRYMFNNSSFNQDISGWCVQQFDTEPEDFATNSPLSQANKPTWGTCGGNGLNQDLVHHYPFDGNANDIVSNNNGTISGAIFSNDAVGSSGQSLRFDGDNDYVELNNSIFGGASNVNAFTQSIWLKVASIGGYHVYSLNSYWRQKGLSINDNDLRYGGANPNPNQYFGLSKSQVITQDIWTHVVVTFQSGVLCVYVDGERIGGCENIGRSLNHESVRRGNSTGKYLIGATWPVDSGLVGNFHGWIDDYRVYNRALNIDEIRSLYNTQKPE
jgi:hypothetical protein